MGPLEAPALMAIPASAALVFLPFVLPLCFYAAFTDMREMRITNQAVLALLAVFVLVAPFLLPLPVYGWQLVQMVVMLVIGILLNMGGAMGAGDSKFLAAAAPYVMVQDIKIVVVILAANMLAAVATHSLAKHTPLRALAPHWASWEQKNKRFPMGLSLAGSLAIYLILGAIYGQ